MVINGYKLEGCELRSLEDELNRIQKKIDKILKKPTSKLLSEEVEFYVDQLALCNLNREEFGDASVLEIAKDSLGRKLEVAKKMQTDSKYNLSCFAYVFTLKDATYLDVHCKCSEFLSAFDKSNLAKFGLSEREAVDENNAKTCIWNEIFRNYKHTADPLSVNFVPNLPELIDEKLTFRTPAERAQDIAIYNITNRYISHLTGGQQVSPIELMYVLSAAQERLTTEEGKQFINEDKATLLPILPNITNELINLHPSDSIESDKSIEKEEEQPA